jgi:DNA helicase-2/ATP-dependent DNA helicase PcrA
MSGFTGTLNPQQREAATHIYGPLLILAGAGTGKTRVVTARIAYMINEGIKPEHILAVTFTNKAAAEMRERVKDMCRGGTGKKVILGTFHAFCAKLLREFAEHVGYKKNFVIYSQNEQISLMKRVLKSLLVKEETLDPQKALARISKSKNDGQEIGDPKLDLYAAVAEKYADEMRALNVMDFDDLLCLGVKLVEENAMVRETLHQRHRFIMVDEFQDTNSLQMRLLRALVPAPYHVCVVGDDDQSIYGWRGAEITNITEFENFFPDPTVVKLEENYRSTTPILHTANSLIVNNIGRRPKSLWSRNVGSDPVRLVATQDDEEEADMISKEIEQGYFSNKEPWESYAVLFRTNDQSRILEQAFRKKKIPYRVVGARSFYDRREVKDILSYLTVLHNPHDDIAVLRVLNTPTRGIGGSTAELARDHSMEKQFSIWVALCDESFLRQIPEKSRTAVRNFTAMISKYSTSANSQGTDLVTLTEALIQEVEYMQYLQKLAKKPEEYNAWENGLSELLNQITHFQENSRKEGIGGFLDQVTLNDEREDKDDIEKKKGVCLITLHASKGLEFPIVYLPGIEKGILPHKRSYEENRIDEERRLFYVGITRARLKLTMSYVRYRTKYGQKQSELPSPFLDELDRTYLDELDYTMHMKETPSQEENTNFFAGLKAMLSEG